MCGGKGGRWELSAGGQKRATPLSLLPARFFSLKVPNRRFPDFYEAFPSYEKSGRPARPQKKISTRVPRPISIPRPIFHLPVCLFVSRLACPFFPARARVFFFLPRAALPHRNRPHAPLSKNLRPLSIRPPYAPFSRPADLFLLLSPRPGRPVTPHAAKSLSRPCNKPPRTSGVTAGAFFFSFPFVSPPAASPGHFPFSFFLSLPRQPIAFSLPFLSSPANLFLLLSPRPGRPARPQKKNSTRVPRPISFPQPQAPKRKSGRPALSGKTTVFSFKYYPPRLSLPLCDGSPAIFTARVAKSSGNLLRRQHTPPCFA